MVSNREDATHDTDIVYPSAIPFVLVHLICIAAIWTGITWQAVTICIVLYWVRIFAIGAGYHRYFSHRAYATSRAFQFVLAVLSQSTAQKSVLWWAAKHRHHHLHSDTECDVHSPRHKGFLYSHLGWIFSRRHHKADLVKVADLACYPELMWLHRFELASPYPAQVKISAVNQVVCVSPHYARLTREQTGWPEAKVVTVSNAIDVGQLDRPKLDGARFHLGLVGIVPSRKRMDLALDVLEELRREDDRYLLFIKSGMPWEHWWVWQNPAEREHYAAALRRVQRSPLLRGAVVFDDAGPDVPAWLRRVGFMLSTSDDESFHVAPAEGMASRAVPVLRHWPGAETIYDTRWIHRGPAEMAAAITARRDEADWRQAGDEAHAQAAAAFNLPRVCEAWRDLLTTDLDPAVPDPKLELLGSG